jgi:hypothetical protein
MESLGAHVTHNHAHCCCESLSGGLLHLPECRRRASPWGQLAEDQALVGGHAGSIGGNRDAGLAAVKAVFVFEAHEDPVVARVEGQCPQRADEDRKGRRVAPIACKVMLGAKLPMQTWVIGLV